MSRSIKTMQRRLKAVERSWGIETGKRESWRASPEVERKIRLGYAISFMQSAFFAGGFYDLGRVWLYHGGIDGALEEIVAVWARRFRATPEQRDRALSDTRRGLAEGFETEEEWDYWWWAGPEPGGSIHRNSPSSRRLENWLKTNPPRWEIAVALDMSKSSPKNDDDVSPRDFQKPYFRDLETIDFHFQGPRWRKDQAERESLHRELVEAGLVLR